jgi:acylphosphatase
VAEIARHVRVTGRVQGVCYRAWTREQAGALSVAGWVRNCPDGSDAVRRLAERLRTGPPSAQVEDVEITKAETVEFARFEVRH